jgi:hypothetical protein
MKSYIFWNITPVAICFQLVSCVHYFSTPKIEMTCSYETSAGFQGLHGVISQMTELFHIIYASSSLRRIWSFFKIEIHFFFHSHKSCRADQYESIYHQVGTVPTNRSCEIASQSMPVDRSVYCFVSRASTAHSCASSRSVTRSGSTCMYERKLTLTSHNKREIRIICFMQHASLLTPCTFCLELCRMQW